MRDFLPDAVRRRQYVIGVVTDVYERYGFEPLETPAVENLETLLGKYGEESNQLIFKILKRGEHEASGQADLALRYDLTVPLARVVAQYRGQLPRFFRRYQIQPVWRADRPARGRFREFYQCDVDALGSRSMTVEAELCAAASDVLVRLGFSDFSIRLNHRQVLAGILDAAGFAPDRHGDALVALDKLDKIGAEGVRRELADRGLAATGGEALLGFFEELGRIVGSGGDAPGAGRDSTDTLDRIARFVGTHEAGRHGVDELRTIVALVASTSARGRVRIDATLARGLSYYTGAIMEVAVPDLAGSLGGGGRYDNLVGMFLGENVPACGFSLGLERVIVVMTERGMFPPAAALTPADVMVTVWNADTVGESLALARELREAGLRVEVYPEADRLGKQFRYASSRGVPFVTVLGDDERAQGLVAIKDMTTGEQRAVARADVASALKRS